MEIEKIKVRIELYKKQQKELIDEANRKIAELAGAIAALEQLAAEGEVSIAGSPTEGAE